MASIKKIEGKNGVSYKITVSCGYDVKGKKIIETATFKPDAGLTPKKMEKAAQDFAHEFESRVKSGAAMDGRKVTLQVFADRWIEEYAKPKLQPGTVRKYREELDDKILPAIGHYKLSEIKPHTVNAFFLSLTKDGARKDGKAGGYSKGSITKTRNVLSSILRTATEWEIIDRNPCDKVRVQAESTADKLKFFTPEQAAAFLQYIEQPYTVRVGGHTRIDDTGTPYTVGDYEITKNMQEQIKLLFNLAIYTGLRKGSCWRSSGQTLISSAMSCRCQRLLLSWTESRYAKLRKQNPPIARFLSRNFLRHGSRLCNAQSWRSVFDSGRTGKGKTGFSFRTTAR